MRGQYPEKQKSHFIARLHGPREAVGPSSVRPSVRDDGGEPGVGWRRGARSIDSWAFLSASLETRFSVGLVAQILRITALSVCYSATLSSIYLLITTNLTCGGGCTAESTPPPMQKCRQDKSPSHSAFSAWHIFVQTRYSVSWVHRWRFQKPSSLLADHDLPPPVCRRIAFASFYLHPDIFSSSIICPLLIRESGRRPNCHRSRRASPGSGPRSRGQGVRRRHVVIIVIPVLCYVTVCVGPAAESFPNRIHLRLMAAFGGLGGRDETRQ